MKKSLVAHMVAGILLLGGSTAAMAAANSVGTHQQNLSINVTAGTCNVTWPTDVSFAMSSADLADATVGAQVGDTKDAGNIELTGCPASTAMKFSARADAPVTGDTWKGWFKDSSGNPVGAIAYRLSSSENFAHAWNLDGTEGNLGTTDAQGHFSVPVYASVFKRLNGNVNPGSYQSVVTYTISYD